MSALTDDEIDALGDGWSEIYRAQDEAEAERLGMWICPECGEWNDTDAEPQCACGYPFDDDETDEPVVSSEQGVIFLLLAADENDAFVYEPDEGYWPADHYYRALDKPSPDDEWWLDSQEEDDES